MPHLAVQALIQNIQSIIVNNNLAAAHANPMQTPPNFENLPESIDLSGNGLTDNEIGYFIDWCIDNPGAVADIERINLSSNSLTVCPQLSCFPALRIIDISLNRISKFPEINNNQNLKYIILKQNSIHSVLALTSNTVVEWLDLSENPLTTISKIAFKHYISNTHNRANRGFLCSYRDEYLGFEPSRITGITLSKHFAALLRPAVDSNVFETAIALASKIKVKSDRSNEKIVTLCFDINANILSFLYQPPSEHKLAEEINILLRLFSDQAEIILSFKNGLLKDLIKQYDHQSLARLADNVVEKQVKNKQLIFSQNQQDYVRSDAGLDSIKRLRHGY